MRDRFHMPPGQFRGPRGEFYNPPGPRGFGIAHALFPWLFLLLFAALVAVAIIALVRFGKMTQRSGTSFPPAFSGKSVRSDQALEDLRLRYARGEIDRDEYLQKSADLGGSPAPPPTG